MEKLDGETGVESQNIPGEGSVFYFILPMAQRDGS
jgi:signal transduction histidine kinase